jgi:uncharacterized membrane protein
MREQGEKTMQNPQPGQQSGETANGTPRPPSAGKAGTGLDANIAAAISYIWIVGLIFFFLEKENKFIRFHAMQSILFGAIWSVVMIGLILIGMVLTFIGAAVAAIAGDVAGSLFGILISLVWFLIALVPVALFVGLILTAIKAYQGKFAKLPVIGNIAEKIVNK